MTEGLRAGMAMDVTKNIQPMTPSRNHSAEIMQHPTKTKRPVVLTVSGKAATVVQDAEADQRVLGLAAEASAAEGFRQRLALPSWAARRMCSGTLEAEQASKTGENRRW